MSMKNTKKSLKTQYKQQNNSNITNYWNKINLDQICNSYSVNMRAQQMLLKCEIHLSEYQGRERIIMYVLVIRAALQGQENPKKSVISNIDNIDTSNIQFRNYHEIQRNKQLFIQIMSSESQIFCQLQDYPSRELFQVLLEQFSLGKQIKLELSKSTIDSKQQEDGQNKHFHQKQFNADHNFKQQDMQMIQQPQNYNQNQNQQSQQIKNQDIIQQYSDLFVQLVQFIESLKQNGLCSYKQIEQFIYQSKRSQNILKFLQKQAQQIGQAVYQIRLRQRYEIIFNIFVRFFERMELSYSQKLSILQNFQNKIYSQANIQQNGLLSNYELEQINNNLGKIKDINQKDYEINQSSFENINQNANKIQRKTNKKSKSKQNKSKQDITDQKLLFEKLNRPIKKRGYDQQFRKRKLNEPCNEKQKTYQNEDKTKIKNTSENKAVKLSSKKQISIILKNIDKRFHKKGLNKFILPKFRSRFKSKYNFLILVALKLKFCDQEEQKTKQNIQKISEILINQGQYNINQGFKKIIYAENAVDIATGITLILLKKNIKNCLFQESTAYYQKYNKQVSGSLGQIIKWCKNTYLNNKLQHLSQTLYLRDVQTLLLHLFQMNHGKQDVNYQKLMKNIRELKIQGLQGKLKVGSLIYNYLCQKFNIKETQNQGQFYKEQQYQMSVYNNYQLERQISLDQNLMRQQIFNNDSAHENSQNFHLNRYQNHYNYENYQQYEQIFQYQYIHQNQYQYYENNNTAQHNNQQQFNHLNTEQQQQYQLYFQSISNQNFTLFNAQQNMIMNVDLLTAVQVQVQAQVQVKLQVKVQSQILQNSNQSMMQSKNSEDENA